jgi:hypothetical protein
MAGNQSSGGFSSEGLKNLQLSLIEKSYKLNGGNAKDEVIDITSSYAWIADKAVTGGSVKLSDGVSGDISKKNDLPFCYVIERRSAVNAGIANIINAFSIAEQNLTKIGETADNIINTIKGGGNSGNNSNGNGSGEGSEGGGGGLGQLAASTSSKIKEALKSIFSEGFNTLLEGNNLSSDLLAPYKYLYITQETGKKYVFPLANNSATFSPVKNVWGNGNKLPDFLQKPLDAVNAALNVMSIGANLANNLTNTINGKGDDTGNIKELAKSYSYPQNGDQVTVNFTLYNTTRLNAWKENYKFLFLFTLRNMPMRIDNASFVPPLLYDVIIPSLKRLPVCSVEGINIVPKGMIRTLSCENFLASDGSKMIVNVPEAWEVTINFRCLIGTSMNLILAGAYGGLNVETSSESGSPEGASGGAESGTAGTSGTATAPANSNAGAAPASDTQNN